MHVLKLLITAAIINFCAVCLAQKMDINLSEFGDFYRNILEENGIVGSSVYIVRDGNVLLKDFYGQQNQESGKLIDEHSIYHWASITKTFTGIAIMQLRDRGLLDLDDPAIKYLPEISKIHASNGKPEDITIRHLLTHSCGLRSATWPWKRESWHPHEPQEWEQLAAMFPYTEIHFEPGSQWNYSNPGIVFLGIIIERLTLDDFEYYIEKNIFKPLGMAASYFDFAPPHLLPHLCQSYWARDTAYLPALFNLNTGITVSNGGLSAPLGDMVKYVNFLLGLAEDPVYEFVLARSSLDDMFRPYLETSEKLPADVTEINQGLTFFMEDIYGTTIIGHSGHQNGFHTHMYLHPESGQAYLVAYNSVGKRNSKVDQDIKTFILKNIFFK